MVLPSFEEKLAMNLGETNLEGVRTAGPSYKIGSLDEVKTQVDETKP